MQESAFSSQPLITLTWTLSHIPSISSHHLLLPCHVHVHHRATSTYTEWAELVDSEQRVSPFPSSPDLRWERERSEWVSELTVTTYRHRNGGRDTDITTRACWRCFISIAVCCPLRPFLIHLSLLDFLFILFNTLSPFLFSLSSSFYFFFFNRMRLRCRRCKTDSQCKCPSCQTPSTPPHTVSSIPPIYLQQSILYSNSFPTSFDL